MSAQEEQDPIKALEEQLREHDLVSLSRAESKLASARLVDSFRKMSGTERRYQLRRLLVIIVGFSIPLLLTAAAWWLKGAFTFERVDVSKEFVGDFPLQARISSDFNKLPGGPPRLRLAAKPGGAQEWSAVFETTVSGPERLDNVYAEFVTAQVAFALYDTLFAVTTNGGFSWQISVLHDTLSGAPIVIDGVMLDERGGGFLFPPGVKSLDSCWTTEDFGLTWQAP